ncbi:Osmotic avoidance abnormal protein 3 [Phytophthora citrophthora]|uniref:Kinesin-like protein n=1 Tax=Phytophthora citrophthora TaxID=4793 RepID=A0AAD9FZW0_9STRA|nr:Osmotic avoidance abnormal protein 3 [Phytophthora citrophthora]
MCRSMIVAAPPTGNRRVRRLRSPGSVAVPRRVVLGLPPVQPSRTADGPSPRVGRSLNRPDLSVIREVDQEGSGDGPRRPVDTVRVVVRCRPMNATERARGDPSLFRLSSKESTTLKVVSSANGGNNNSSRELVRSFQFDLCASEELSQGQFFRACGVIPLLESVVEGYIATVFAYGQTGSGKTYSMSGLDEVLAGTISREERAGASSNALELSDGLIPRALKHLFMLLEQEPAEVKTVVRASYCEIYNEQVFDLLNPGSGALNVRWNARAGFYVQDLLVVRCDSLSDVLAVVNEGHRNRHVASHCMNADSSRSHSLLTIHVDRTKTHDSDSGHSHGITRYGKMSFVDLAGSERLKETRSSNAEEASNINRSLLTLGKVISALASAGMNANTGQFIPYRDSKLTKLLMDSLGGQSLTLMIACVSPSAAALEDTLSTLNYATRAKNIRNKPAVQVDPIELELSQLRHENHVLRAENEALRLRLQLGGSQGAAQLQRPPSLTSIPSNSRLLPMNNASPTTRAASKTTLPNMSPSRLPTSQRNQLQALQDDHEKMKERALAAERRLQQLEVENRALRQQQEQSHQQQSVSKGYSSPINEMKQLRQQVQQLQQREQELMQALSRRSRRQRESQESGESARHH